MSARLALATLLAIAAAAGVACNKDKENPTPTAAALFVPLRADSLPSHVEEEQKAYAEITPDNYKAQLDQTEKEIDQP